MKLSVHQSSEWSHSTAPRFCCCFAVALLLLYRTCIAVVRCTNFFASNVFLYSSVFDDSILCFVCIASSSLHFKLFVDNQTIYFLFGSSVSMLYLRCSRCLVLSLSMSRFFFLSDCLCLGDVFPLCVQRTIWWNIHWRNLFSTNCLFLPLLSST